MLVLGNAHKKRNLQNMSKFLGEISKYFKGSQNMVKNPEKICHILHKVKSIIGHLEIFFSKFKTFLQEVLEFGEENFQDTSMLVLRKTHQKKESSTCVKISSRNFDICQRFPEYGEKRRNLAIFCTK